jgi:hypothetical protein
MADLSSTSVATLTTLVTATVFSTTFLSGRVHQEQQRALDRALKLGDSLAERIEHADASDATELSSRVASGWLDQQAAVLESDLADRFPLVLVAVNIVLAVAIATLAVVFGSQADISVWPLTAQPAAWALIGYVGTAVLVVGVGTADVLVSRRGVRDQFEQTPIGLMLLAQRASRRAARSKRRRGPALDEALQFAEDAVAATAGRVAQAWATLGYVHLLRLALPRPPPPTLLHADECMRKAIDIGPPTAPMWAAWAVVAEGWDDDEQAVDRWLAALSVLAENFGKPYEWALAFGGSPEYAKLSSSSGELRSPQSKEERQRSAGSTESTVYSWLVRPTRITTLTGGLDKLDPADPRTIFAAQWLAIAAGRDPANLPVVEEALVRVFQRLGTSPDAFEPTLALATALRGKQIRPEIRRLAQGFLDRALQAPFERLALVFEDSNRRRAESEAKMDALNQKSNRKIDELRKRAEDSEARRRRVEAGLDTPEDRAALDRLLSPEHQAEFEAEEERHQARMKRFEREQTRWEEYNRRRAQLEAEKDRLTGEFQEIKLRWDYGRLRPSDRHLVPKLQEDLRAVSEAIDRLYDEQTR